jgi:phosphatidylglycerol:prolipoprotein diacylglycerol transferase
LPILGVTVRAHNAFEALAVVVGIALIVVVARRFEGLPVRKTLLALVLITASEFFFGRLHFIVAHWDSSSLLSVFKFWSSIHAAGTVFGAVVGAIVASRLLAIPLGKLADAVVPAAGIGIALARLGCFAHGCCFGTRCTLPWCFSWPSGSAAHAYHAEQQWIDGQAAVSLPIHPLQLYFAAVGLCVTVGALWLYRRKRYDGQIALAGLLVFAVSTLALESLREFPQAAYWGPFQPLGWAALALCMIALAVLVRARSRRAASC